MKLNTDVNVTFNQIVKLDTYVEAGQPKVVIGSIHDFVIHI